jgi:hypothetical protein
VCADGGQLNKADTQIDDADVMSTTLILRRVYESRMRRLRRMKRDRATVGEGASAARNLPLTLVIEFNDSLTRRLLRRRPDLLNPNHGDPSNESTNIGLSADSFTPIIDEVYLHRGYLETTALSISAHSHVDWSIMQLLLTHGSGASVRALSVADVLDPHELSPHPGTATRKVMPAPRLTPRQRHEESPANARARRSVLATLGISVGRLMGARARAASPTPKQSFEQRAGMAAAAEEPKRPANAYWIWLGENRDTLTKEAGSSNGPVVGKLAGEKWKAMSAAAKKPFEDRAAKLKAEYDTALEEFKAGGGQVGKRRLEKKEAKDAKADKKAKKEARKASGKPTRPASAYWLWLGENREALAKEAGSAKPPVVAKLAGEKWKALSAAAKKPFEAKASELKAAYDKALEEWKSSGGGEDGDGEHEDAKVLGGA